MTSRHRAIWRRQLLTSHRIWLMKQFWKQNAWARWTCWILLAIIGGFFIAFFFLGEAVIEKETVIEKKIVEEKIEQRQIFEILASNAYVVGRYGNGVDWDGTDINAVSGSARVQVDPFNDLGQVSVSLEGVSINPEDQTRLEGKVEIIFKQFSPYEEWQERGIVTQATLFGTRNSPGYYPPIHAFVAGFGTAEVRLDGQVVYNDLDGFFFYGSGMRRENGSIQNARGEAFRPKTATGEFVEADDRELHVIVHSRDRDTKNYPPYETWINVFFEETTVISHPQGTKI